MVQKLSGFAKFEMDYKIGKFQFFHLKEECCMVEDTNQPEASVAVDAEGNEETPVVKKVFS
jgi:hypothetical protein